MNFPHVFPARTQKSVRPDSTGEVDTIRLLLEMLVKNMPQHQIGYEEVRK